MTLSSCFIPPPVHVHTTRYGSVSQYLVSAGFAEEEQEKLRAVFFHPKEEEEEEED